ncbi:MAG: LamG domain-containing protein [Chloroflexaceae bacterium]|nr:LamG domain-containing protein [Chloroflexaceae bacterium]
MGAYEGSDSLVALYTFEEGSGTVVRDVSGVGTPLDLTLSDPLAATWISGGLSVDTATIIASSGAATKIINAAKASNELTVEAWVQPSALVQGTPSRIVTLSADTSYRNFTLAHGQVMGTPDDRYSFRLRTTATDLNGMTGALTTPDGSLTLGLTHVVYTRDASGNTNLYLDGVSSVSGSIGGDFSNWDDTYRLALANEFGGGRSWLGEYYQVTLYRRALSATEVGNNFAAGP